jgi:hypothetical protein
LRQDESLIPPIHAVPSTDVTSIYTATPANPASEAPLSS